MHFGRAAAASFVSQPALSAQVRELERRLGVELVERSPRRVLLSAAGAAIVDHSRRILRDVDDLVDAAEGFSGDLSGALHLGAIPTVAPYLLAAIVPIVHDRYPGIELHLHEHRTASLVDQLRAGDIDLALLAPPIDGTDLHLEAIIDDPFVLAMPTGHPLADNVGPLRLADLRRHRILLLNEGHCLRDQTIAVCALADTPTAEVQATSLATLTQMVAGGLGITLLPTMAVDVEARAGAGIEVRSFRDPPPHRVVSLAWRRSSPRGADYEALARHLAAGLA